ncbi:hypothetical protein [Nocardia sp. NPDC003726]
MASAFGPVVDALREALRAIPVGDRSKVKDAVDELSQAADTLGSVLIHASESFDDRCSVACNRIVWNPATGLEGWSAQVAKIEAAEAAVTATRLQAARLNVVPAALWEWAQTDPSDTQRKEEGHE